MSMILPSLRTHWKYQGLGRFFFLATRKALRPIVVWDIHYIFHRSLRGHDSPPPSPPGIAISLLISESDLDRSPGLASLCPQAAERLRRGGVVIVAFANPGTTDEIIIAGYTWITFSSIWLPELDLSLVVRPGEMVHYDSYVSDPYRGQGLHTILIQVAKHYALSAGCTHSISWISALNMQSLKTAKRLVREPEKPTIVLSGKLRGMKRFRNVALRGSLASRFQ